MLLSFLLALIGDPATKVRRPPRVPPGTACRQPDGRIRLGCLPPGTVRALPQQVPAPKPTTHGTAAATPRR